MARRRSGAKRLKETRELMMAERARLETTRPPTPFRDRRIERLAAAIADVGRAQAALLGDDPTPDWEVFIRRANRAARTRRWDRAAVYVGRVTERPAWRRAPTASYAALR
jgi:hypothetical protein